MIALSVQCENRHAWRSVGGRNIRFAGEQTSGMCLRSLHTGLSAALDGLDGGCTVIQEPSLLAVGENKGRRCLSRCACRTYVCNDTIDISPFVFCIKPHLRLFAAGPAPRSVKPRRMQARAIASLAVRCPVSDVWRLDCWTPRWERR